MAADLLWAADPDSAQNTPTPTHPGMVCLYPSAFYPGSRAAGYFLFLDIHISGRQGLAGSGSRRADHTQTAAGDFYPAVVPAQVAGQRLAEDPPAWLACVGGLHLAPLLLDPTIYSKWFNMVSVRSSFYFLNSPGIFSLSGQHFPEWVLVLIAALIVALALRLPREGFVAGLILIGPVGIWYNSVLLAGSTPWYVLIPISWAAFILSVTAQAPYPFALIPLTGWIWYLAHCQREASREKACGPCSNSYRARCCPARARIRSRKSRYTPTHSPTQTGLTTNRRSFCGGLFEY